MPPRRRRPRGHIEQLPSGKYRARVYAGLDPLTRKKRYLLQTAPTYEAAQKAATKLQQQVDEPGHECGMGPGGGRARERQAQLSGRLRGFGVEVEDHLHVVGDEADGHDHDGRHA